MGIIETLLLVVFAISALLLIIVVLMQDDQGEGLGGIFGGGSSTPFGSSSGNVLTKITGVLGVIFIVSSLGMAYITRTVEKDDVLGEARRSASEQTENWFENNEADNSQNE
ncbi:MAG: preprotein translocase subunit SecG [Spirochaetales bacterium]|nr:preprotein translocase subunit SecG [Spirochaetales bacterium]